MHTIILLGDSLTQQSYRSQWGSCLSDWYIRRADVLNRGLSGYTSRWVLDILNDDTRRETLLPPRVGRPLFVTLMLGSNDAAMGGQHVPLEEYKSNLYAIIEHIRKHASPIGGIFLLTPPPIDEEGRIQYIKSFKTVSESDRTLDCMRSYRNVVLEIASKELSTHGDVFVIDLYKVILGDDADTVTYSKGPWCNFFNDGLHFNESGGLLVFEALQKAIGNSKHAEIILPEKIPYTIPSHDTLWNRDA